MALEIVLQCVALGLIVLIAQGLHWRVFAHEASHGWFFFKVIILGLLAIVFLLILIDDFLIIRNFLFSLQPQAPQQPPVKPGG